MSNKPTEDITYTLEFKSKQKKKKKDIKKMLFAILFVVIIGGAAVALVFGIGIAKDTI